MGEIYNTREDAERDLKVERTKMSVQCCPVFKTFCKEIGCLSFYEGRTNIIELKKEVWKPLYGIERGEIEYWNTEETYLKGARVKTVNGSYELLFDESINESPSMATREVLDIRMYPPCCNSPLVTGVIEHQGE